MEEEDSSLDIKDYQNKNYSADKAKIVSNIIRQPKNSILKTNQLTNKISHNSNNIPNTNINNTNINNTNANANSNEGISNNNIDKSFLSKNTLNNNKSRKHKNNLNLNNIDNINSINNNNNNFSNNNFVQQVPQRRKKAIIDRRKSHAKRISNIIVETSYTQQNFLIKWKDLFMFLLLNSIFIFQVSQLNLINCVFTILIFHCSLSLKRHYNTSLVLLKTIIGINLFENIVRIGFIIAYTVISSPPNYVKLLLIGDIKTSTINFFVSLIVSLIFIIYYYLSTSIERMVMKEKDLNLITIGYLSDKKSSIIYGNSIISNNIANNASNTNSNTSDLKNKLKRQKTKIEKNEKRKNNNTINSKVKSNTKSSKQTPTNKNSEEKNNNTNNNNNNCAPINPSNKETYLENLYHLINNISKLMCYNLIKEVLNKHNLFKLIAFFFLSIEIFISPSLHGVIRIFFIVIYMLSFIISASPKFSFEKYFFIILYWYLVFSILLYYILHTEVLGCFIYQPSSDASYTTSTTINNCYDDTLLTNHTTAKSLLSTIGQLFGSLNYPSIGSNMKLKFDFYFKFYLKIAALININLINNCFSYIEVAYHYNYINKDISLYKSLNNNTLLIRLRHAYFSKISFKKTIIENFLLNFFTNETMILNLLRLIFIYNSVYFKNYMSIVYLLFCCFSILLSQRQNRKSEVKYYMIIYIIVDLLVNYVFNFLIIKDIEFIDLTKLKFFGFYLKFITMCFMMNYLRLCDVMNKKEEEELLDSLKINNIRNIGYGGYNDYDGGVSINNMSSSYGGVISKFGKITKRINYENDSGDSLNSNVHSISNVNSNACDDINYGNNNFHFNDDDKAFSNLSKISNISMISSARAIGNINNLNHLNNLNSILVGEYDYNNKKDSLLSDRSEEVNKNYPFVYKHKNNLKDNKDNKDNSSPVNLNENKYKKNSIMSEIYYSSNNNNNNTNNINNINNNLANSNIEVMTISEYYNKLNHSKEDDLFSNTINPHSSNQYSNNVINYNSKLKNNTIQEVSSEYEKSYSCKNSNKNQNSQTNKSIFKTTKNDKEIITVLELLMKVFICQFDIIVLILLFTTSLDSTNLCDLIIMIIFFICICLPKFVIKNHLYFIAILEIIFISEFIMSLLNSKSLLSSEQLYIANIILNVEGGVYLINTIIFWSLICSIKLYSFFVLSKKHAYYSRKKINFQKLILKSKKKKRNSESYNDNKDSNNDNDISENCSSNDNSNSIDSHSSTNTNKTNVSNKELIKIYILNFSNTITTITRSLFVVIIVNLVNVFSEMYFWILVSFYIIMINMHEENLIFGIKLLLVLLISNKVAYIIRVKYDKLLNSNKDINNTNTSNTNNTSKEDINRLNYIKKSPYKQTKQKTRNYLLLFSYFLIVFNGFTTIIHFLFHFIKYYYAGIYPVNEDNKNDISIDLNLLYFPYYIGTNLRILGLKIYDDMQKGFLTYHIINFCSVLIFKEIKRSYIFIEKNSFKNYNKNGEEENERVEGVELSRSETILVKSLKNINDEYSKTEKSKSSRKEIKNEGAPDKEAYEYNEDSITNTNPNSITTINIDTNIEAKLNNIIKINKSPSNNKVSNQIGILPPKTLLHLLSLFDRYFILIIWLILGLFTLRSLNTITLLALIYVSYKLLQLYKENYNYYNKTKLNDFTKLLQSYSLEKQNALNNYFRIKQELCLNLKRYVFLSLIFNYSLSLFKYYQYNNPQLIFTGFKVFLKYFNVFLYYIGLRKDLNSMFSINFVDDLKTENFTILALLMIDIINERKLCIYKNVLYNVKKSGKGYMNLIKNLIKSKKDNQKKEIERRSNINDTINITSNENIDNDNDISMTNNLSFVNQSNSSFSKPLLFQLIENKKHQEINDCLKNKEEQEFNDELKEKKNQLSQPQYQFPSLFLKSNQEQSITHQTEDMNKFEKKMLKFSLEIQLSIKSLLEELILFFIFVSAVIKLSVVSFSLLVIIALSLILNKRLSYFYLINSYYLRILIIQILIMFSNIYSPWYKNFFSDSVAYFLSLGVENQKNTLYIDLVTVFLLYIYFDNFSFRIFEQYQYKKKNLNYVSSNLFKKYLRENASGTLEDYKRFIHCMKKSYDIVCQEPDNLDEETLQTIKENWSTKHSTNLLDSTFSAFNNSDKSEDSLNDIILENHSTLVKNKYHVSSILKIKSFKKSIYLSLQNITLMIILTFTLLNNGFISIPYLVFLFIYIYKLHNYLEGSTWTFHKGIKYFLKPFLLIDIFLYFVFIIPNFASNFSYYSKIIGIEDLMDVNTTKSYFLWTVKLLSYMLVSIQENLYSTNDFKVFILKYVLKSKEKKALNSRFYSYAYNNSRISKMEKTTKEIMNIDKSLQNIKNQLILWNNKFNEEQKININKKARKASVNRRYARRAINGISLENQIEENMNISQELGVLGGNNHSNDSGNKDRLSSNYNNTLINNFNNNNIRVNFKEMIEDHWFIYLCNFVSKGIHSIIDSKENRKRILKGETNVDNEIEMKIIEFTEKHENEYIEYIEELKHKKTDENNINNYTVENYDGISRRNSEKQGTINSCNSRISTKLMNRNSTFSMKSRGSRLDTIKDENENDTDDSKNSNNEFINDKTRKNNNVKLNNRVSSISFKLPNKTDSRIDSRNSISVNRDKKTSSLITTRKSSCKKPRTTSNYSFDNNFKYSNSKNFNNSNTNNKNYYTMSTLNSNQSLPFQNKYKQSKKQRLILSAKSHIYSKVKDKITDHFFKEGLSYFQLIKIVFYSIILFFHIHFEYIVYMFMIINHMVNACLLSIVLPVFVLLIAVIQYPRPRKGFWKILILYMIIVLLTKFSIQLKIFRDDNATNNSYISYSSSQYNGSDINSYYYNSTISESGSIPSDSIVKSNKTIYYQDSYRIGLIVYNSATSYEVFYYVIYDVIVLFMLIIYQFKLIKLGLWRFIETDIENIFEAYDRIYKYKSVDICITSNNTRKNTEFLLKPETNYKVDQKIDEESDNSNYSGNSDKFNIVINEENNNYNENNNEDTKEDNANKEVTPIKRKINIDECSQSRKQDEVKEDMITESSNNNNQLNDSEKKEKEDNNINKQEFDNNNSNNNYSLPLFSDIAEAINCKIKDLNTSNTLTTQQLKEKEEDKKLKPEKLDLKQLIKKRKNNISKNISDIINKTFPILKNEKPGTNLYFFYNSIIFLIIIYEVVLYSKLDRDNSLTDSNGVSIFMFSGKMVILVFGHVFLLVLERYFVLKSLTPSTLEYKIYHKILGKETNITKLAKQKYLSRYESKESDMQNIKYKEFNRMIGLGENKHLEDILDNENEEFGDSGFDFNNENSLNRNKRSSSLEGVNFDYYNNNNNDSNDITNNEDKLSVKSKTNSLNSKKSQESSVSKGSNFSDKLSNKSKNSKHSNNSNDSNGSNLSPKTPDSNSQSQYSQDKDEEDNSSLYEEESEQTELLSSERNKQEFDTINIKKYSTDPNHGIVTFHFNENNTAIKYKFAVLIFSVIFIHYFIFIYLPDLGNYNLNNTYTCEEDAVECNEFTRNPFLIFLYILYLIYFFLSALQIKLGFPELRKKSTLVSGFSPIHYGLYLGYKAIPFVYETSIIIDWTFTETAIEMKKWFKLQNIYDNLFLSKCEMNKLKERKKGERYSDWIKGLSGGTMFSGILIAVFIPLFLFSNLSPDMKANTITKVDISLNLEINRFWNKDESSSSLSSPINYYDSAECNYTLKLNLFNTTNSLIEDISESYFDKKGFNTNKYTKNLDLKEGLGQVIKICGYPSSSWVISYSSFNNFADGLKDLNATVKLEMGYYLKKSRLQKEITSQPKFSIELNNTMKNKFYDMFFSNYCLSQATTYSRELEIPSIYYPVSIK